ncbi:MAG: AraC family transcriptional regulator [Cyclobacteriaceae bacterium]
MIQKSILLDDATYQLIRGDKAFFEDTYHFHDEIEIVGIVSGRGELSIGDQQHEFNSGEVYAIGNQLPHQWKWDESYEEEPEIYVLNVRSNLLGHEFLNRKEVQKLRLLISKSYRGLKVDQEAADKAIPLLQKLENADNIEGISTLLWLLKYVGCCKGYDQLVGHTYTIMRDSKEIEMDDKISMILKYIKDNIQAELSTKSAAVYFSMSEISFSRYFKSKTNMSFIQFVNEFRISQAIKLMYETDLNIKQIAYEVGYNNIEYFNKRFKSSRNITPTEYKDKFQR